MYFFGYNLASTMRDLNVFVDSYLKKVQGFGENCAKEISILYYLNIVTLSGNCLSIFKYTLRPKKHACLFPPGLEPGTLRVLGARDNHYTTETFQ